MKYLTIVNCETVERDTKTDHPISDSEPVIWEGEATSWGALSGNERMSCERNIDGVLEGGYPI